MSRKFIVAIAAVAALGMSTLLATDASARFGGGGGGFHGGGFHGGGRSVGHVSRASFQPSRLNRVNTMSRTTRTTRVTKFNHHRPNTHRPNPHHVHYAHHHHHSHAWWRWCRHHHYRCGGYPWIEVGGDDYVAPVPAVYDAPQAVAATPVAAVCNNDCDYFLKDEPGCYMAKRAFSTPAGDELRCVKICEEPENTPAVK
jgi:hypothetical protein